MSAFTEPLAQAREAVARCSDWNAANEVLAALAQVERLAADYEKALAACGKHLEDCCRTDIEWDEQMRSHDDATESLGKLVCPECGELGCPGEKDDSP